MQKKSRCPWRNPMCWHRWKAQVSESYAGACAGTVSEVRARRMQIRRWSPETAVDRPRAQYIELPFARFLPPSHPSYHHLNNITSVPRHLSVNSVSAMVTKVFM